MHDLLKTFRSVNDLEIKPARIRRTDPPSVSEQAVALAGAVPTEPEVSINSGVPGWEPARAAASCMLSPLSPAGPDTHDEHEVGSAGMSDAATGQPADGTGSTLSYLQLDHIPDEPWSGTYLQNAVAGSLKPRQQGWRGVAFAAVSSLVVLSVPIGAMGITGLALPPRPGMAETSRSDAVGLAQWVPKHVLGLEAARPDGHIQPERIVIAALGDNTTARAATPLTRAEPAPTPERTAVAAPAELKQRDRAIEQAVIGKDAAAIQPSPQLTRKPTLATRPIESTLPAREVALDSRPNVEEAAANKAPNPGEVKPLPIAPVPRAVLRSPSKSGQSAPRATTRDAILRTGQIGVKTAPFVSTPPSSIAPMPAASQSARSTPPDEPASEYVSVLGLRIPLRRIASHRDRSWTASFFDQR